MLCHRCKEDRPEDNFGKVKRRYAARERSLWCRACINAYQKNYRKTWKERNPEKAEANRRRGLIVSYGISVDEHDSLLSSQGGACAICKQTPNGYLDIDHCHSTGKVRGLLCNPCNRLLGDAMDNANTLIAAAEYLKRHGIK